MNSEVYDWNAVLNDHPILSLPKSSDEQTNSKKGVLELSLNSLPHFTHVDPEEDGPTPSGRRQVMILKDADLILAVGKDIRITSLVDSKLSAKSYKVLHTPNIEFEIHQLVLNPTNKLLAVAGAFQVAVVVLPRPGFTRLVSTTIDCKCTQVGQFYHGSRSSPPIAKVEWHPWGDAGSTLLVMTVDGKLREYDVSVDTDEPQQILSFLPDRSRRSFLAEDASERQVASFTFGKGQADWGPLTVYAVMKSGDVYSICPYMPKNASIPSSYVHTLECFVLAKQEFLSESNSARTKNLSALYDYQHKYITALLKQLPPGTVFPAASRSVLMHPPTTIKSQPLRQGPFLLQPSPRTIGSSEGGDATDIVYMSFGNSFEDCEGDTERLGVMIIVFQDGRVDICLDVDKIEARWENKQERSQDLPMLAVYETIDLGLVSFLRGTSILQTQTPILNLLQGNHPSLLPDPIHDDTVYVHHAFGVHALHLGPMLRSLALALGEEEHGTSLDAILTKTCGTDVHPILNTFSVERKCSNPVVAVAVPDDVYLAYSIFIMTSAMRLTAFALTPQFDSPRLSPSKPLWKSDDDVSTKWLAPADSPPAYVSLLGSEPFAPPSALSRPLGLPSNPYLAPPDSPDTNESYLNMTPDILRYLAKTVECFTTQIHEVQLAHRAVVLRLGLQTQEFHRQQDKCREMMNLIEKLKGHDGAQEKMQKIRDRERLLLTRLDRLLRSLMRKASPELSEHETKWFGELRRLKEEISGAGRYDEGSMTSRTALLEREYARILPDLKIMLEKEAEYKKKHLENNKGLLGFSQAFEFGKRSNNQRVRIQQVEEEVLSLSSKLDLSLERPPARQ